MMGFEFPDDVCYADCGELSSVLSTCGQRSRGAWLVRAQRFACYKFEKRQCGAIYQRSHSVVSSQSG